MLLNNTVNTLLCSLFSSFNALVAQAPSVTAKQHQLPVAVATHSLLTDRLTS